MANEVFFEPGVLENMTPEQKQQIITLLQKQEAAKRPSTVDIAKGMAGNYVENKIKNSAISYFDDLIGGGVSTAAAPSVSLIPAAPELSSGLAESLAMSQAKAPFLPGQGATPAAPGMLSQGLGAAGAAYGAYQAFKGIKDKNPMQAGMGGLGAGLGLNAMGYALGPWGWAATLAAPTALAAMNKLFDHESTRDVAKRHTKELGKMGQGDVDWGRYLGAMREQHNAPPPDPSKPFHGGQYSTWDEYKKAGLDASDLTGVYGNLKSFGPDWSRLNFDQQKAVTQGLIDNDLYKSKKGEVIVTDENRARAVMSDILAKFGKGDSSQATPMPRGGSAYSRY